MPKQSTDNVDVAVEVLCDMVESYERDHPNWLMEQLLWLMGVGVDVLRDATEKGEANLSWPHALVNWPFPVQWNWAAWRRKSKVGAGFVYEQLTPANTKTSAQITKIISTIMVQHLLVQALQELTHGVGYERRGNVLTPILSPETASTLSSIRSIRDRKRKLQQFLKPFSVGDLSFSVTTDGRDTGGHEAEVKGLDLPPLDFTISVKHHDLKGSLNFQVHPLVIDGRRKEAYYPLTVCMFLLPVAKSPSEIERLAGEPWANPLNWTRKDQNNFWHGVKGALVKMQSELEAAEEKVVEKEVSFSGSVKIFGTPSQIASAEAAVIQTLADLYQHGEVIQLGYGGGKMEGASTPELRLPLIDQIRRVEDASTPASKGVTLEELLARVFAVVPGFEIKSRVRTDTEEIDLVILNGSSEARWRSEKPLILVECKNWSSPCGKNELVQFIEKLRNRRRRSSLGFFVSWNGFAETFHLELLRSSHEEILIVPISGDEIREAARSGNVLEMLKAAWDKATAT